MTDHDQLAALRASVDAEPWKWRYVINDLFAYAEKVVAERDEFAADLSVFDARRKTNGFTLAERMQLAEAERDEWKERCVAGAAERDRLKRALTEIRTSHKPDPGDPRLCYEGCSGRYPCSSYLEANDALTAETDRATANAAEIDYIVTREALNARDAQASEKEPIMDISDLRMADVTPEEGDAFLAALEDEQPGGDAPSSP